MDGASRLAVVGQTVAGDSRRGSPLSFPDYLHYRDHARSFAELSAHYSTSPMSVVAPTGTVNVTGAVVTANYFGLLRLRPALGRFFSTDEDAAPGRNPVAIVSHDFWRNRLGADGAAIGTTVRINGTPFAVIGVAPEGFRGVFRGLPPNDVWIPAAMFGVGYRYCDGLSRGCRIVDVLGRLAAGASIEDAHSELSVLAGQLASTFPVTNRDRGVSVQPARGVRGDEQARNAPIVALLAGASVLVLLVASANVAGLLLARGLRRRREIAIRFALGATRGRLVRLMLVESVLLSFAGSAAGFALAMASKPLLLGFFRASYQGAVNVDLSLDPRIVLAGFAVALVTGIATGIAPALQSTRPDTLPALKDETAGAGARRSLLREGLIVVQVAVSIVILAGSTLLVRSFVTLHRGPGFNPDAVVVLRLRPSLIDYTNERAWAFQREAVSRLESLPGVVAASLATTPTLPNWNRQADVQAGDGGNRSDTVRAAMMIVGERYFEVLGIGVGQGREFDRRERPGSARAAIVNETLARRFWPGGTAVGRALVVNGNRHEVVGVVRDLQYMRVLRQPEPMVYLNFWQQDRSIAWTSDSQMHVRIAGPAAPLAAEIRRTLAALDPDVPVSDGLTLGERLNCDFADVHAARAMMLIFGGLTLVLCTIGLYAALSFAVGQRTREIAIRMALGAARAEVGTLVLRRGAAIVGAGLADRPGRRRVDGAAPGQPALRCRPARSRRARRRPRDSHRRRAARDVAAGAPRPGPRSDCRAAHRVVERRTRRRAVSSTAPSTARCSDSSGSRAAWRRRRSTSRPRSGCCGR